MAISNAAEKRETTGPATRARILAAAERLFAEDGYAGVSMPAIARASGITAGAIYKHFDSKEDLFFEVVQRAVQAVRTNVDRGADGADLPRIVANYTKAQLRLVRLLAIEIHSASTRHAKVRRLLRRSIEGNIAEMKGMIEIAQAAGRVDAALDAEKLASAVLVFVMGLAHMETLLPHLIDDAAWHGFVEGRVAAMLGTPV
jgi:AcrR family transcriptional regulator